MNRKRPRSVGWHAESGSIQRRQFEAAAQRATRWMWINIAVALAGFWLSLVTLVAAASNDSGGTYVVVFSGAVMVGTGFAIKNGIALSKAEAGVRGLAPANRPDAVGPSTTRSLGVAHQAGNPPTRASIYRSR